MKINLLIVALFFLSTGSFSQSLSFQEIKTDNLINGRKKASAEALNKVFKAYKVLSFDVQTSNITNTSKTISLQLPGMEEIIFHGQHNAALSDKTEVTVKSSVSTRKMQSPKMIHFNGVSMDQRDRLSFSVGDHFLMGAFVSQGQEYFIEPVSHFDSQADDQLFVIYKLNDVIAKDATCGTTLEYNRPKSNNLTEGKIQSGDTPRTVEFALAADYTTYANHGQSVDNVTMYLSGIVNLVQGLYFGNFANDLTFQITEIIVFTSPQTNPWPSTNNIDNVISYFGSWASGGFSKPFDLSQYWFYTSNFGGGAVGIAYTPSSCNNQGNSAIREYNSTIVAMRTTVAHEIGHNFSAQHDANGSPYVMAPVVSGSTFWSGASISSINSWLGSPSTNCFATPGLVISHDALNQICPGATLNFSASLTAPLGESPSYQWKVNGNNVGSNSATYATNTLMPGDFVSCSFATTISGNPVVVPSNNLLSPVVSTPLINGSLSIGLCDGSSKLLESNAVSNAQWYKDDVAIDGATGSTLLVNSNGSYSVKVVLANCESPASNSVAVTLYPVTAPVLTADSQIICGSGSVTLTCQSPSSIYTWYRNNIVLYSTNEPYISATSAGSYTVKVPCTGIQSNAVVVQSVTPPPAPTITAGGPITFCYGGSVTLTSSASTGNQWYVNPYVNGHYTTQMPIDGATDPTLVATIWGIYSVFVTANNCTTSSNNAIIVTVKPVYTATVYTSDPTTVCQGASAYLISSFNSTGNQWYKDDVIIAGATTEYLAASVSGSYSVKTTVSGCESPASNAIVVTVNPLPATPAISAGSATTFCQGSSVTLTSNAASGNQWYSFGSPISGATATTLLVNSDGYYTVISTSNGCASGSSNTIVVSVNPVPPAPVISIGGSATFCEGQSVNLFADGSSGNNQWYKNGNIINGAVGYNLTVNATGNYTVKSTSNGCTSNASGSQQITVNPIPSAPTVSSLGPTTFCEGGTVTLTSSAPAGNQWFMNGGFMNGSTGTSIVVSTSANYSVWSTVNGCASNQSAAISVTVIPIPTTPSISTNAATTFCQGTSVNIQSNAPTGNQWYRDGIAIASSTSQSINAGVSGSYTVKVTANGCTSASSNAVDVNVIPTPPTPTISASGPIIFCEGGNVTLTSSASTGNQWYLFGVALEGSTGSSILVDAIGEAGNYSVKTISTGCTSNASAAVTVTVNPKAPTATISALGPTTFCQGGSVTVNSSVAGPSVTSQWFKNGIAVSGLTGNSVSLSTAGNYSVVSTINGCESGTSNVITVTVLSIPTTPTISAVGSTSVCQGTAVTLNSNQSTGNQWYFNGNILAGSTATSLSASAAGTYTARTTVGGCTSVSSNSIVVTVNPFPSTPTVTAIGLTTFCQGGNVTLTSNASDGNQWYNGSNLLSGARSTSLVVNTTGIYSVKSIMNGCASNLSNSISVTVNAFPTAPTITSQGNDTFCEGGSVTLTSTGTGVIEWYKNGDIVIGSTGNTLNVSTSGNYKARLTITGCTSGFSNSLTVTENPAPPAPTITAESATTFCEGGTVKLNCDGSGLHQWFRDGNLLEGSSGTFIIASVSGSYRVTTTSGGCESTASNAVIVTINSAATPIVFANSSTTICQGESVTLTTTSPGDHQWYFNGAVIPSSTGSSLVAEAAGAYSVKATFLGCESDLSAIVDVTVNPVPLAPTITQTDDHLSSSTAENNQWYFNATPITNATQQTYTPTEAGSYTVTVTVNGCESPPSAEFVLLLTAIPDSPSTDIVLYPNPTNGPFSIDLTSFLPQRLQLNFFNAQGMLVLGQETIGGRIENIDLGNSSAGVYYLEIKQGKNLLYRKIMKQ